MTPRTAGALREMMTHVVDDGTGTAAQLPGISVAGKTGTAETGTAGQLNDAWFIAFAPADNPQVAIAVVVEDTAELRRHGRRPIAARRAARRCCDAARETEFDGCARKIPQQSVEE